jgi:hypothetical protein
MQAKHTHCFDTYIVDEGVLLHPVSARAAGSTHSFVAFCHDGFLYGKQE